LPFPEETTLHDRAEIKEKRLIALAEKRNLESNYFSEVAKNLSNNLFCQPVLNGHHSQRKIENAEKSVSRVREQALNAFNAVGYWLDRAEGVGNYANMKNSLSTRKTRIETLYKELRKHQKNINDLHKIFHAIKVIQNKLAYTEEEKRIKIIWLFGCIHNDEFKKDGKCLYDSTMHYGLDINEAVSYAIDKFNDYLTSSDDARSLKHTLNRIGYESSFLPETKEYEGELTPVIIQAFIRNHGGDKPKATKSETGFLLKCNSPLPVHIGSSNNLDLSSSDWKKLMVNVGYTVPYTVPKKKALPILNFKAQAVARKIYGNEQELSQVEMTKEEYSNLHKDEKYIYMSSCGKFRFRVAHVTEVGKSYYEGTWHAVYLTDVKAHPTPESEAITHLSQAA